MAARVLRWGLVLGLVMPAAAVAQQTAPTGAAHVTYLSPGWVFIDAGSEDGLRQGSRVEIIRRGRAVVVLRVESLGLHQASCVVMQRQALPRVGDSVRFSPIRPPSRTAPPVATPAPSATPPATPPVATPAPSATPPATRPPVATPTPSPAATAAPPVKAVPPPQSTATIAPARDSAAPAAPERTREKPAPIARPAGAAGDTAITRLVTRPAQRDSTPLWRPVSPPPAIAVPVAVPAPHTDSIPTAKPPQPTRATRVPAGDSTAGTSTVTFVSGAEIYVGAGRQAGLVEGSELDVVRRDSVISTLRVKYLASQQSSCEVIRGANDIAVGDVVRFVAQPIVALTRPTAAARRRRPHRLSGPGIHGRVGLRYLRATSATDSSGTATGSTGFNQPSFDVRMNGLNIGGTQIGLALDLRTRRTVTSSTGQPNRVDGHTRVYQAAIFWGGPGAGFRAVAGRQYLTAVTSVSMFDGGLLELNRSHVTFGAFGGLEPDAFTLGLSPDIQDYGGYLQFHSRQGTAAPWSFTVGGVGSYQASQSNREFAFMQASVYNRYFSFYGLQEVDYYPPWKVQLGERRFSFTSQYANVLVRPSRWLSFIGSYDKRRSVRLYRDTQNPETTFDDAYRQGYGGGIQLTGRKVRLGGDWRRSTGGTAGGANSFTGTFGLDQFTPLKLGFSARATWYQNQNDSTFNNPGARRTSGQLYSGRLGFALVNAIHLDFDGGLRREDNPNTAALQKSTWYGVDLDVSVARAWFVSFSGLRQQDPANPGTSRTTQLYASVTWRF